MEWDLSEADPLFCGYLPELSPVSVSSAVPCGAFRQRMVVNFLFRKSRIKCSVVFYVP